MASTRGAATFRGAPGVREGRRRLRDAESLDGGRGDQVRGQAEQHRDDGRDVEEEHKGDVEAPAGAHGAPAGPRGLELHDHGEEEEMEPLRHDQREQLVRRVLERHRAHHRGTEEGGNKRPAGEEEPQGAADAGAGKEDGGGGAERGESKQRHREGEQQIRQEVRGNHARTHLIHGCLDCDFWVQGHAGQPDHDGGSHAERGQDDRADDARAALAQLLGLTARVEHPDHQQERGHGLQPQALEADVLALGVRGQNAQRTHDCSVRSRSSQGRECEKSARRCLRRACRSTPCAFFSRTMTARRPRRREGKAR